MIWPGEAHVGHIRAVDDISRKDMATKGVVSSAAASAEPDPDFIDRVHMRHDLDGQDFGDGYFSTVEEYLRAEATMRSFWSVPDLNKVVSFANVESEADAQRQDTETPTLAAAHKTPKRDMRTHYEVLGVSQYCNDKE